MLLIIFFKLQMYAVYSIQILKLNKFWFNMRLEKNLINKYLANNQQWQRDLEKELASMNRTKSAVTTLLQFAGSDEFSVLLRAPPLAALCWPPLRSIDTTHNSHYSRAHSHSCQMSSMQRQAGTYDLLQRAHATNNSFEPLPVPLCQQQVFLVGGWDPLVLGPLMVP